MRTTRSRRAASIAALIALFGCGSDASSKKSPEDSACDASSCPPTDTDTDASDNNPGSSEEDAALPVATLAIGKACETSQECGADLVCHTDTQNYIGHHQCTESCQGDTCPAGSKCIGAEICVAECTTSADCPEKSTCSKNGWCSRTGPGSGVPFCDGIASSCYSAIDSLSCIKIRGCSGNGDCAGISDSCYSQYSSFSCTSLDGCSWSSTQKKCSGVSRSCTGYSSEFSCKDQTGCRWDFECSGTPNPCDGLPVSVCTDQTGCFVNSGA